MGFFVYIFFKMFLALKNTIANKTFITGIIRICIRLMINPAILKNKKLALKREKYIFEIILIIRNMPIYKDGFFISAPVLKAFLIFFKDAIIFT